MTQRVVILGFGDTGILTAAHLKGDLDVVAVSAKPCMVSGQELGLRLSEPTTWRRDYLARFGRYRRLDDVRIVQGEVVSVDTAAQTVSVRTRDGAEQVERYDALVIATGVTNGFWRSAKLESFDQVQDAIDQNAARVRDAGVLAVVGGGATAVSVAHNTARRNPSQQVHLFFGADAPLKAYHPRVREEVVRMLEAQGVTLHAGHRVEIPDGFALDAITDAPLSFEGSSESFGADAVVWAIGRVTPNTGFLPPDMLDERGFVRATRELRVPGYTNVFAVGDVAATDPNRSSARNAGYRTLAQNLRAWARRGDSAKMKSFKATEHRWGSIFGLQPEGMLVFTPRGGKVLIPRWLFESIVYPLFVRGLIYGGMRPAEEGR